jgi:hypothetical protein
MPGIEPIMTRVAYVTTSNTGGSLAINGPEGQVQMHRVSPDGVVIQFGPAIQLSVHKELLPIVGRYFLAAALLLGVDINEGWDSEQSEGAA